MTNKVKSWEGLAIDLVYRDKDPVTVAVLQKDHPNLEGWISKNIKRPSPTEVCFVYTYDVTIH